MTQRNFEPIIYWALPDQASWSTKTRHCLRQSVSLEIASLALITFTNPFHLLSRVKTQRHGSQAKSRRASPLIDLSSTHVQHIPRSRKKSNGDPCLTGNLKLPSKERYLRRDLQNAVWKTHTSDCRLLSRYMIISKLALLLSLYQVRSNSPGGDKLCAGTELLNSDLGVTCSHEWKTFHSILFGSSVLHCSAAAENQWVMLLHWVTCSLPWTHTHTAVYFN